MSQSIVKDFEVFKKRLADIIKSLGDEKFLSKEEVEELINKLNREKLILSIVGQMKYGKSTFLNALLFGKPVLPTSDTPMTAALTALEYGNRKEAEVEFYTKEEWQEILTKLQDNSLSPEEREALEHTVKTAQKNLGANLEKFFGKKIRISFENLEDYVGAEGKYTPIVKMVKIFLPEENLKESQVVDTPGFNDPVVSREKRAEEFLRISDAVILFLYAQRPFDKTDRDLLIRKIPASGISHVIVVLNKVDLLWDDIGDVEKVKEFVEREFKKAISEIDNEYLRQKLSEAKVIPLSGLLALLGKMPQDLIEQDEDLQWYFLSFKEKYPFLKSKEDFIKYSGILELEEEIKNLIKSEKINILKNKFKHNIISILLNKYQKLQKQKQELSTLLFNLNKKEEELKNNIILLEQTSKEIKAKFKRIKNELSFEEDWNQSKSKIALKIDNLYKECIQTLCNAEKAWSTWNKSKFSEIFNKELKLKTFELLVIMKKELMFLKEKIYEQLDEFIDKTALLIEENEHIKKISNYDIEFFENLRETIKQILRADITQDLDKISVPEIKTGGWLIFGDSKEEATEKARNALTRWYTNLKKDVNKIYKELLDLWLLYTENRVWKQIESQIITPIKKSLEDSIELQKRNKEEIEKKISSYKEELEKLNKELVKFEEKVKEVKTVLEQL